MVCYILAMAAKTFEAKEDVWLNSVPNEIIVNKGEIVTLKNICDGETYMAIATARNPYLLVSKKSFK